jgi:hypothetical protein
MPAFLDPRDLRILIGAGVVMLVLLGLVYAVGPAPAQQSIGFPSSYSSEWAGAKAAFLLLQDEGYHVERWERSPEDLPAQSAGVVLVLAEPFESGTVSERTAIRRFVTGGGRVLAIGAGAASLAPDADAKGPEEWDPQSQTYSAQLPSPFTRGASEITMAAPDTFTSSFHPWLALYGREDKIAAVSYRVGRGEVVWWASATPLTNGAIRDKDNLSFFLNCIGAPSKSHVLWDEYFHGARGSLVSYFEETPLPWAGVQIGIAFIAIVFTFSRRAGPARAPAVESRLSPLEFVETLGDLYQSAHASPAAVGVAYKRLRLALLRKLGLSPGAKLPEVCHAAANRFGWPEAALLDTLARSERTMRSINPDEREALYLVRQLHDYSNRLGIQGRSEQETPAWR